MSIVFADPCELYVSASTSHGPSAADAGASFAIADRHASGYQTYRFRSVVDSAGEGGRLTPRMPNDGSGNTPGAFNAAAETMYVHVPFEITDATPAVATNAIATVVQGTSPFFFSHTFRINTSGNVTFCNNVGTVLATGARTLADNTKYHFLFGFDATNGVVKLWIGDDASWELSDPTDWDNGNEDLTYTDATQNGTFAQLQLGWWAVGKTNPNSTVYLEGISYDSAKPIKTRKVWYIPADAAAAASEYESGGGTGTNWTDEGGAAATTEKVDDGTQHDTDTTYVVAEAGIADGSRWSCHLATCASVSMASDDQPIAIMPFFNVRKETNSSDLTDLDVFIRNGGVNLAGDRKFYRSTSYEGMWSVFTGGASGQRLTQSLIDDLEIGLIRNGTSSDPTNTNLGYRCTMAGLIVVTEKQPSLVVPHHSFGRTLNQRR